ncbi:MAG: flagellar biosynthetic protein FliO [Treponema sp.]|nr:flagellar biosynthetic protein FliO [Treponema sp.]
MGNLKKYILFTFFVAFVNVFVFSQTDTSQSSSVESSVLDESQILLGETNPESQITFSDDESNLEKSSVWLFVRMILVLILVIVAIYALMKFFKKKSTEVKSSDDFLRSVSSLSFGPGKSVEIVTLIDKAYVLGVTEKSINLIAEIDDKELIESLNLNHDKKSNVTKPINFAEVLDMFVNPKNKRKASVLDDEAEKTEEGSV